jgi:hypothetical protein
MSEVKNYKWPSLEIASGNWEKKHKVDSNAPFYFKLKENNHVIKKFQHELKTDPKLQDLYAHQFHFVEDLKQKKFWIRIDQEIIFSMTLFDVYNGFLKFLRDKTFEDQLYDFNEISFHGPAGPYRETSLIECMNETMIDKMIFNSLMKNKLPMRDLRVHTEGSVLISYGEELKDQAKWNVRQITESGILFSSYDETLLDTLTKGNMVKVQMDTRPLKTFINNNLKMPEKLDRDFFYTDDELRYFYIEEKNVHKTLSYKSGKTNEVFFFCRFHHMLESDVPNIFMDLNEKLKDYFKQIA